MKKRNLFVFFIVLIMLLFVKSNVYADSECTTDELRALKIEALNMEFNFNRIPWSDDLELGEAMFEVSTLNYSNDLKFLVGDVYYTSELINENNEILVGDYFNNTKLTITIYGSYDTNCENTYLLTKTINVPYYNYFSERSECKGYEKYDICKQSTNTKNITEEQFLLEMRKIRDNVPSSGSSENGDNRNNIFIFMKKNILFFITVFALIIIILVVLIKKKIKKPKIKVKIDV